MNAKPILILGGTTEAAELARRLDGDARFAPITSLAGRTRDPAALCGEVRSGGFGGPGGLADYLAAKGIARLVDATHPYAATISRHASIAAAKAGIPLLRLERPPWPKQDGDRWIEVEDIPAAVELLAGQHLADTGAALTRRASGSPPSPAGRGIQSARQRRTLSPWEREGPAAKPWEGEGRSRLVHLAPGTRVFLSIGRQDLAPFSRLSGIWFLLRMIDPPSAPPSLADYDLVLGRGPFDSDAEARMLSDRRIDTVVSKNSGGKATYGKIAAARRLGLPVVMVGRPTPCGGDIVDSVDAAMGWLAAGLHHPSRRKGGRQRN